MHIVSFEHLRRSSRVPKELAILLIGSDMDGKSFSEMTKTVLLSRHGAGIVSIYKLSAEQEIIIRYLDSNKEAIVRVVGRIGSEGESYTYGVAFVDAGDINFWGIDFAPTSEKEKDARRVFLECANCKTREMVEHSDVESDVLIVNEGIVRYCKVCSDSTLWKRAAEVIPEAPSELIEEHTFVADRPGRGARRSSSVEVAATAATVTPPSVQTSPSTHTSPTTLAAPSAKIFSPAPQATPPASKTAAPIDNRRKHPRTKVNYKACIRRPGYTDDIVTCEDMSKGGLCFKSHKQYFPRIGIEVAVPYAPGGNAIFVPGEVAWVVEITKDKLYKCGVAYRTSSKTM